MKVAYHQVTQTAQEGFRVIELRGPTYKRRVCDLIQQCIDGPLRRDEIAAAAHFRPAAFRACFKIPRKPTGRRVFCLRPALARSSQPTLGMRGRRRLGRSQNPSPQDPTQF